MGRETGLWAALVSAIADTLQEVSGNLMGRTRASYTEGATSISVLETHRWPSFGRIAFNGVTGYYGFTTASSLLGLTDEDGNPGLPVSGLPGDPITLISSHTDMDDLRDAFFVDTAEGADLDTLGRNYGLRRVRGMDDSEYRAFLKAVIAIEGGTVYAMEKVLDAVIGTYTLYEDLETDGLTVYVVITATAGTVFAGKAYLVGLEAQARTSNTTVDVDEDPTLVYGVWDSADPDRSGTNYTEQTFTLTEIAPDKLTIGVDTFTAADEARYVIRSDGVIWKIRSFIDARTLQVGTKTRTNGSTSAGVPTRFAVDEQAFRAWMVGHDLVVLSGSGSGAYAITAVDEDLASVTVPTAAFLTDSSISWFIRPSFAGATGSYRMHRASWSGVTVTTPVTMPANVLVDYTTIQSAQVVSKASVSGDDQYPLYLFDETFLAAAVLDIVHAAGIRVVVLTE